ncbi:MAG TPA: YetF domain-containing protein [Phycisphaerales bacterium]|nr:YetF domain-containing protein [Phycisphaerales bacterium]
MLDAVLRATVIYIFLIVVFRLSGRRTIGQATTFDLMLLLIISEAVSQALANEDPSLKRAVTLVLTLVLLNVLSSFLKFYSRWFDRLVDGSPVVLVRNGRMRHRALRRTRVDEEDIMESARLEQGVSHLSDIRLAVLERSGHISIVKRNDRDEAR